MKIFLPSRTFAKGISLVVFGFTFSTAYAQKVGLEVTTVSDNRVVLGSEGQPASNLIVSVSISGLETDDSRLIKAGKITRAVDNLGNAIPVQEGVYDAYTAETTLHLRLYSAQRTATEISVLEGTLKYFTPTVANNGRVAVDKFREKTGANILKGKYDDIVLVPLDRKKLQRLKNEDPEAYRQELENLKKEYGTGADHIVELDDLLGDPDFENDDKVLLFYYDPDSKIYDLILSNGDGERIYYNYENTKDHHLSLSLEEGNRDLKMELWLENPQSVKELPFTLKNIKLP